MKMGDYIKFLRENLNLTQSELGQKLVPPVNKAAINKWETGRVENIKRTHIEQLSLIFNVPPSKLMCFDNDLTRNKGNSSEPILTNQEIELLNLFNKLNVRKQTSLLTYAYQLDDGK